MNRPHALAVQDCKLAILRYARDHNTDSAVLVQAMAEMIGMTAAVLDRETSYQNFDERMAEVMEIARATYRRGPGLLAPGRARAAV